MLSIVSPKCMLFAASNLILGTLIGTFHALDVGQRAFYVGRTLYWKDAKRPYHHLLMLGKRSLRSSRPTAEQTRANNRRHPTQWSLAAPRFRATFEASSKMGRGCKWCTQGACCWAFQEHLSALKEWREGMRSLSKERHNAELLLIFAPKLPSTLNAPSPPPASRKRI